MDNKTENVDEELKDISKVRKDIIEDCKIALGYPVISLFITQGQINRLIDFSVRKCSGKACPRFLKTFNAIGGAINVSEYKMEAVSAVYEGDISSSNSGENSCTSCSSGLSGCNVCEQLCQNRSYSYGLMQGDWNNELYDRIAYQYAKSEMDNLKTTDYYLDVPNQMLYLDGYSGIVTVEYTKNDITVEDLQYDSYWSSWVRDYTLAMVKITEGRIRSKYKISSGVFEIESDELISEGNTDKQELEEKLNENIGYYSIMRG